MASKGKSSSFTKHGSKGEGLQETKNMLSRSAHTAPHPGPDRSRSLDNVTILPAVPSELKQEVVDIFKNAFLSRFSSPLHGLVQEIKGYLYARDFKKAFENPSYLEAYAVRWSAGRALAYLTVFHDIQGHVIHNTALPGDGVFRATGSLTPDASNPGHLRHADETGTRMSVTCFGGGGGAEVVALAGFTRLTHSSCSGDKSALNGFSTSVNVIDIADWSAVLGTLEKSIVTPAPSGLADTTTSVDSAMVSPDRYAVTFQQADLLNSDVNAYARLVKDSDLITLMFTLNELYTNSISKTTRFLLTISSLAKHNTLLLVVDSPGSYSTVSLGDTNSTAKKYPMQWLLDHTLLSLARGNQSPGEACWEKLLANDSKWFRLPNNLQYPIDLENTRYQMHLYRCV